MYQSASPHAATRLITGAVGFLVAQSAQCHSFGILYNLPVPFTVYLYAGAATLAVTFLMTAHFLRKSKVSSIHREIDLTPFLLARVVTDAQFISSVRVAVAALFLLALISGLIGSEEPYSNFNMTFFWIIFVLGFAYAAILFGNFYGVINPWGFAARALPKNLRTGFIPYPPSLGYYPALVFYFLLIWLELIGDTSPMRVSLMLATYLLITFIGVITFGAAAWFKYAEVFAVFFRLIAKAAPIEYRSGRLYARPPFIGLIREPADHFSLTLFILFMLSSTAFDGFKETVAWVRIYWTHLHAIAMPIFDEYQTAYDIFDTAGLALSLLLFLGLYFAFIALAKQIAASPLQTRQLAVQFAHTLIPIALVYNLAHYYPLMFTVAPGIIRLISDPLGMGWNIFGTAENRYGWVPPVHIIWHSQVVLIVLGHVVSVYLAHVAAVAVFLSHKKALLSQTPMLLLMVVYTIMGLWILAQPITAGTVDMFG